MIKLIWINVLFINFVNCHESQEDMDKRMKEAVITYGSSLKLKNSENYYLFSSDIIFDEQSTEKVVSSTKKNYNSELLWQIKEKHNGFPLTYNQIVRCGDVIRLESISIRRNLHVSQRNAMISGKTRISSFGKNGNGNTNDNWKIECNNKQENSLLYVFDKFYLKNINNNKYLFTSENYYFNQNNCGHNCPVMNHLEVSGITYKNYNCIWSFEPGLIFDMEPEEIEKIEKKNNILDSDL